MSRIKNDPAAYQTRSRLVSQLGRAPKPTKAQAVRLDRAFKGSTAKTDYFSIAAILKAAKLKA